MSAITITGVGNTSNTTFRTWVQAIHDLLEDGGWVQTDDTGQADIPTLVVTNNNYTGYEIWSSNDAADGLVDIYIKIEYGTITADVAIIRLTAGWASNGAGTLTGITTTATSASPAVTNSGTVNACAGSGYLCFANLNASTGTSMILSLERTRDTTLAFQNEVHVISHTYPNWFSQCATTTVMYADAGGSNQSIQPLNSASPRDGLVGLGMIFGMDPGPTSPSINILGAEIGSLGGQQQQIAVTLYGVTHHFMIQGSYSFNSPVTNFMGQQDPTVCLTRYE